MKIHYVLPEPMYKHYTGFPDMIGQYSDFPEHQEWRFKGQLQQANLHMVLSGKGYVKDNGKEYCLGSRTGLLLRAGTRAGVSNRSEGALGSILGTHRRRGGGQAVERPRNFCCMVVYIR